MCEYVIMIEVILLRQGEFCSLLVQGKHLTVIAQC